MRTAVGYLWRAVACALAHAASVMLGAPLTAALGAAVPALPAGSEASQAAAHLLAGSLALGLGVGALAAGLGVGFLARWAILALLAYVCLGVNTAIESAIFTTFGGTSFMLVLNAFSAVGLGAALAGLFRPAGEPALWRARFQRFRAQFPAAAWAWRLALAVLAFPLVYLTFGAAIAPLVEEAYRAGRFGLTLPGPAQLLAVQLVRSVLYLAACVPVLVAWRGSRVGLALALGAAHFVLVGLYGMLQAHWLPAFLRVVHSVEMLADSLAYAALLVVLLVAPRTLSAAPRQ